MWRECTVSALAVRPATSAAAAAATPSLALQAVQRRFYKKRVAAVHQRSISIRSQSAIPFGI